MTDSLRRLIRDVRSFPQEGTWERAVYNYVTEHHDPLVPLDSKWRVYLIDGCTVTRGQSRRAVVKYFPKNRAEPVLTHMQDYAGTIAPHIYQSEEIENIGIEVILEAASATLANTAYLEKRLRDPHHQLHVAYALARHAFTLEGDDLVHADLKPANVLFIERRECISVLLNDFEHMQPLEAYKSLLHQGFALFGTPGYIPPEAYKQERNNEDRNGSDTAPLHNLFTNPDIFSYGVLLAVLLKGHEPQIFSSLQEQTNHMLTGSYREFLSEGFSAEAPQVLREIIDICTKPLSRERFQSFAEILDKLYSYVQSI